MCTRHPYYEDFADWHPHQECTAASPSQCACCWQKLESQYQIAAPDERQAGYRLTFAMNNSPGALLSIWNPVSFCYVVAPRGVANFLHFCWARLLGHLLTDRTGLPLYQGYSPDGLRI